MVPIKEIEQSPTPTVLGLNHTLLFLVEFNPALQQMEVQHAGLINVRLPFEFLCKVNRQIGRFHLPHHACIGDALLEISAQVENFVSRGPCKNNVGHYQASTRRRKPKIFVFERT